MVGFMKGLGCGCCGGLCDTGYQTGEFADDFSTRDEGWLKPATAGQSQWDSNWQWDGSKLKCRFASGSFAYTRPPFWTYRKVASEYKIYQFGQGPNVFTDQSVDVTLTRPRIANPPSPSFPFTGYGYGSGGGCGITLGQPSDIANNYSGYLWSATISWGSQWTFNLIEGPPGSSEFISVMFTVPINAPTQITNYTTSQIIMPAFSSSQSYSMFLLLFDPWWYSGSTGNYPGADSQTWNLRVTFESLSAWSNAMYTLYINNAKAIEVRHPFVFQNLCDLSSELTFHPAYHGSLYRGMSNVNDMALAVDFDNYLQTT